MNRLDATFCGQCFARKNAAFQPPAPFVRQPALAGAGVAEAVNQRWAPAPQTFSVSTLQAQSAKDPLRWTFGHLLLFFLIAWVIPGILSLQPWRMSPPESIGGLVNTGLLFQLGGYVLAAMFAVILVRTTQSGDWNSLGLTRSSQTSADLMGGFGFGLSLIGGAALVGYGLSGGKWEFDDLMKLLVGNNHGIGILLAAIVAVIGAPLIEEIYFRGMLYEKLNRHNRWLAIIVTSVLFVAAHGSLIIPSLYMFALILAWKRQTKSLWYTIGAHSAWNLVVTLMAVFFLVGTYSTFTSKDGSYSLEHPTAWHRNSEAESQAIPGMSLDLALAHPNNSFLASMSLELPPGNREMQIRQGLGMFASMAQLPGGAGTVERTSAVKKDFSVPTGAIGYEISARVIDSSGQRWRTEFVLVVANEDANEALLLSSGCMKDSCEMATKAFDHMRRSLEFNAAG